MSYEAKDYAGVGINAPNFRGSNPKARTRSVRDAEQASKVFQSLVSQNTDRNLKNARIMAKYNSERPWKASALETEGLSWKANFSTKVLSTLIDRVSPRFLQAVDALKYFTSSKLPDSTPGADHKTEAFRAEITKLIRNWPGWRGFMAQVAQENGLFGFTFAAWLNEFTWKPTHFRQDMGFVPTGTKQSSDTAQVLGLREFKLPHELFALVEDTEAADAAGWNVANALESINNALPETVKSKASDMARRYEDLTREACAGNSHQGAKVVVLDHLFAQEVDGKVSHFIVDGRSGKELFTRMDQFDSMPDGAVFFSFQEANGTLHGSKGIGREVYALAGVLERARNEVVDRLQLSGKMVLQADEKLLRKFKAHVVGPALLIGSPYTISQQTIDGTVEPFFQLDQYMTGLLDQIAGNVSPRHLEGERVTKAQVDLFAAREEESKDIVIGRFLSQFSVLVSQIQRKACDPQCVDEDAKAMRQRLLTKMSEDELMQLAEQPSAEVVRDLSELQRQQIIVVATENRGNPLYNQKELERRKLTAQIGADFAEAVLMPDNDPTVEAEQARLQQLEVPLLQAGQEVPVSPRDNHVIHCMLLQPIIESGLQVAQTNPEALEGVKNMLAHMQAHIQEATKIKDPTQNVTAFAAFVQDVSNRLAMLAAHDAAVMNTAASGAPPELAANAGAMAAQSVPSPQAVAQ